MSDSHCLPLMFASCKVLDIHAYPILVQRTPQSDSFVPENTTYYFDCLNFAHNYGNKIRPPECQPSSN
jgi:hypothetical protein